MRLKSRYIYLFIIVVIASILYVLEQSRFQNKQVVPKDNHAGNRSRKLDPAADAYPRRETFNRKASKLIYTKHAKCRMKCRNIDETEVREILSTGRINYEKSEPAARPDPKFAVEGRTHDEQRVRIIFAQAARGLVVVTVIDLEKDWSCNCK